MLSKKIKKFVIKVCIIFIYQMHNDLLPHLSAAIEGLSKRGRSSSRESESRKRQMSLDESFRSKFSQQRARQGYTR
jgi:hypothetical protein